MGFPVITKRYWINKVVAFVEKVEELTRVSNDFLDESLSIQALMV